MYKKSKKQKTIDTGRFGKIKSTDQKFRFFYRKYISLNTLWESQVSERNFVFKFSATVFFVSNCTSE